MASQSESDMGINSWLEDELYQQYLHDRSTVDESWKHVFEEARANGGKPPQNGATAVAKPAAVSAEPATGEQLVPLRGAAGKIAVNMEASLSVPVATSFRTVPVKVM